MNAFTDLRRALSAEVYKLKHNSIPVTVIFLPAVITVLMNLLLPLLQRGRPFVMPGNPWLATSIGLLQLWGFIQLFTVAVVTAQLAGLEHGNNRWKYLFALPVSRQAVYVSKVIVSVALFGVSLLTMLVTMLITGWILTALRPDIGFNAAIPWSDLLKVFAASYLASWLLISLHVWAAHHWQNFGPAMGVAMVAFLISMATAGSSNFQRVYPWALPTNFFVTGFNLSGNLVNWDIAAASIAISLIAGVIVVIISAWQVTRRDVM